MTGTSGRKSAADPSISHDDTGGATTGAGERGAESSRGGARVGGARAIDGERRMARARAAPGVRMRRVRLRARHLATGGAAALGVALAALGAGCQGASPDSSRSAGGASSGGATGGSDEGSGVGGASSSGGAAAGGSSPSGGVTGGRETSGGESGSGEGVTGGGGSGGGGAGGTGSEATIGGSAPGGGGGGTGGAGTGGIGGTGGDGVTGGTSAGGASGGAETGGAATGGASGGAETGGTSGGGTNQAGAGGAGDPVELPAGLYWDFEQLEQGQVAERSGLGPALSVDGAALGEGLLGSGLALTGAAPSAATAGSVLDTAASYSVAAWVRLDAVGTYHTFLSADADRLSAFYLQLRDGEAFAFTTFPADDTGASPCVAMGAMRPRAGEWYHLVGTRDAVTGAQRLYQDGVLVGAATCPGAFGATGPLVVGRGRWDSAPTDFLTGGIDEVFVTDAVLSPREVVEVTLHDRPGADHFLFAYFAEQAQGRGDGLRLAHSHDGLHWGAIGAHRVFMPPEVGGGSFRDPHVLRAPDGDYHLVWTTSCVPWAESGCVQDRGFGHARSPDLVHWSAQDYVPVALEVEHVWAPETVYDADTGQFMVFWSSPLDEDPSASDPHRIYYLLTPDFSTFSEPRVLFERPGRNFIDATIYQGADGFWMFLKDEADGQKNIRALSSPLLFGAGAWTAEPSSPLTGAYAAEGPSALEDDGRLLLYFDRYGEGLYGALRSTGLVGLEAPAAWEEVSASVYFAGVRHGTPIRVPADVFREVALRAGE